MTSLSQKVADHVAGVTFEDLPPRVVAMAKRSLLDAFGVTLAASGLGEGCSAFVDLALEAGGAPQSTIIGYGVKAPMLMAALANGAMAHALDYEDAYEKSPMHPNAQLIPAVLALAEARPGTTGRDLITAIAVGCDLTCRLGLCMTNDPAEFGWYTPPILGTVGAAAACAKVMGLSADQVLDALSLAIGPAASSAEVKYSPKSVVRGVRDAFSAHAGLLAARLAAKGVRGFDQPLEGRAGLFQLYARGGYDADILLDELGRRFEGEHISFKPWPCCRGVHPFIEAALHLRTAPGVAPETIVQMSMVGGRLQQMLFDPPDIRMSPHTPIQAKFSGPYTAALALIRGRVTLDDFSPADLADDLVLSLAGRSRYTVAPGAAADNPTAGALTLILADGGERTYTVLEPLGHPSNPLDQAAIVAKFLDCARHAARPASEPQLAAWIATIATLEAAPDIGAALFDAPNRAPGAHAVPAGAAPGLGGL